MVFVAILLVVDVILSLILKCCETFHIDMIMFLLLNVLAQIQRHFLICFTKLLSSVFGPCVSQVPAIETDHVTAT